MVEQKNNNSNAADDNLMFVVEPNPDTGPHKLYALSIESKSLEHIHPNRPNFSQLNSSAGYEFLGGCDQWVVLSSDDELLWNPTTGEVRPIPQFQVKPRLPVHSSQKFTLSFLIIGMHIYRNLSDGYKFV
ncbi:F-box and associated interaction domains-containing protein [Striga asiatica]|uniref:F-box and associated interaction domains-containing protein n=1 Tax=Striga asiatica TaxID=4170 RepID=A0A5A7Q0Z2_STRAF|nr:F-box and associated interaction domains-containing protein [Striga asiatica]